MAAKRPSLTVVRKEPSEEYPALIYEIWCARLSSEILGPIEDASIWNALLQASYGWKEIYKAPSKEVKCLRQSAMAFAALDEGHYSCWAELQ